MVYLAANDGMLHGFDADTGVEKLAYVPNAAYSQLTFYVDSSYDGNHRYTVSTARYNQMIAAGYSADGAVFCAASATDAPQ